MKAKSKKRYVALAHVNEPELTYRDVKVPHVVPLYVDFDPARHVGSARLRSKGERIYAITELNFNVSEFGKTPAIVLGVEDAERVIEEGICYLQGGYVAAASIVSNDIWNEVYGELEEVPNDLV